MQISSAIGMTEMTTPNQPSIPYLLFHHKFIVKSENNYGPSHLLAEPLLSTDLFKTPSFAIDIDCRKFSLKDVVKRRTVYAWWNLPVIRRNKFIYIDYIFGPSEQLTFEEAREEFVEYVCAHRWCGNSHETEKQFRARNAKYRSMAEMIEPVDLKGNLPRLRLKRK